MPEKVKVGPASTLYRDGSDEGEGNQMVSFHAHQDGLIALELLRDTSFESSKLFYAAQSLEQITLSPGLMRQMTRDTIEMMQGEMNELTLEIEGEGEIVSVVCDAMLGWEIEEKPTHPLDDWSSSSMSLRARPFKSMWNPSMPWASFQSVSYPCGFNPKVPRGIRAG